jgi:hypothetical protein
VKAGPRFLLIVEGMCPAPWCEDCGLVCVQAPDVVCDTCWEHAHPRYCRACGDILKRKAYEDTSMWNARLTCGYECRGKLQTMRRLAAEEKLRGDP